MILPTDPNNGAGAVAPAATCSPSSLTPETDALADEIYARGIRVSEIKLLQHARELERERNDARRVATLMRDAMRCRPEIWNYAIDYYETLFPENA